MWRLNQVADDDTAAACPTKSSRETIRQQLGNDKNKSRSKYSSCLATSFSNLPFRYIDSFCCSTRDKYYIFSEQSENGCFEKEKDLWQGKRISRYGELEIYCIRQGRGSNSIDRKIPRGIVISSPEDVVFLPRENCTREYIRYFRYSRQNCRWYCAFDALQQTSRKYIHTYTQWSILYLCM